MVAVVAAVAAVAATAAAMEVERAAIAQSGRRRTEFAGTSAWSRRHQ